MNPVCIVVCFDLSPQVIVLILNPHQSKSRINFHVIKIRNYHLIHFVFTICVQTLILLRIAWKSADWLHWIRNSIDSHIKNGRRFVVPKFTNTQTEHENKKSTIFEIPVEKISFLLYRHLIFGFCLNTIKICLVICADSELF